MTTQGAPLLVPESVMMLPPLARGTAWTGLSQAPEMEMTLNYPVSFTGVLMRR